MHRVLDRLLLSSLSEANDPFFLKAHGVQAIIHFGEGGMFGDDIKLYHRSSEHEGHLTDEELADGIDFLRESLRAGRRVLAVGANGATLVAAYLSEMGFGAAQALEMTGAGQGSPEADEECLAHHEQVLRARSRASLNHR